MTSVLTGSPWHPDAASDAGVDATEDNDDSGGSGRVFLVLWCEQEKKAKESDKLLASSERDNVLTIDGGLTEYRTLPLPYAC